MGDLGVTPVPTVLVTGFGLFRSYAQNSSWLTVQELLKLDIKDMNIVIKQIPVEYDTVAETVPKLWEEYKPELTVHCGMSAEAKCLTMEKLAQNKHYIAPDVQQKLPEGNVCCQAGPNILHTALDIQKAIDEVEKTPVNVKVKASEDAGRYLCEFIYYTSLRISKKTVFIHVPPVDQPYSVREMAESLVVVIRSLLKQCANSENTC